MAIPTTQNSSPERPQQLKKKKKGGTQKSFTLDDWVGKKGGKSVVMEGLN